MTIYPAIDLFEGKVVRLKRGDYKQMTVYSDDPVSIALGFKKAGATAIHIVDLEGARDGMPANCDVLEQIVTESGLFVQVGGGIRTFDVMEKYLDIGVQRVIVGTAAISTPGFLQEAVENFGDTIAVSVDIKDGFIAIKGWTEVSNQCTLDFCKNVCDMGVKTLICTDISRDGMLCGTNMGLYRSLRSDLSVGLIASGGVSTLIEVKILSEIGIDGAVLGRALYTRDLDLEDAIKTAKMSAKG
ncbi:MAG: 1-(5-phosphoribosyl)-5-[(5-phosphoribosylamino)methylideneamino]imidazole-4-carboxamide isomerase [Oscillospiraceae bacterium]|jgi:phosphoribosylformimino-5-aminoimidazole carboxamide ribotide isomerase|nr:1-(5-phosphoribosyl)-5-[(5-phosphoribosylamino)methylideneamino]imidazole-4-carboxamide isomerase [Oscillospiraceae bacterium]